MFAYHQMNVQTLR